MPSCHQLTCDLSVEPAESRHKYIIICRASTCLSQEQTRQRTLAMHAAVSAEDHHTHMQQGTAYSVNWLEDCGKACCKLIRHKGCTVMLRERHRLEHAKSASSTSA